MIASKRSLGSSRGEAHHHAVEDDVLARGQLGVEADAELDEGRQPTGHPDRPGVGSVDAGEDLQQGALAGAVAADDAEELALAGRRRRRRRSACSSRKSRWRKAGRPAPSGSRPGGWGCERSCAGPRPESRPDRPPLAPCVSSAPRPTVVSLRGLRILTLAPGAEGAGHRQLEERVSTWISLDVSCSSRRRRASVERPLEAVLEVGRRGESCSH